MARHQKNRGASPCVDGTTARAVPRRKSPRVPVPGVRAEDVPAPLVIEVSGNEEFLDKLAAIFAEQVLAARAEERERREDG